MRASLSFLILVVGLGLNARGWAAEFGAAEFDKATEPLKSYRYGQKDLDLERLERWVASATVDTSLRPLVEQRLLDVLAAATTLDARQFILRQLKTIGTVRAVSALEALLTDPELSHLARYALGSMEGPAAVEAMQRALGRTSGDLQAGIINTLARRSETSAQAAILSLLNSPNTNVVVAAVRALGSAGDTTVVARLFQMRPQVAPAVQREIDDTALRNAEHLIAAGYPGAAAKIYELYFPKSPSAALRVAGLRGLAVARPEKAEVMLVEAIRGSDAALRDAAIALMASSPGAAATTALTGLCETLPAEGQELVLRALASRGDRAAGPAVIAVLARSEGRVRRAACEALGEIGGAGAIPVLAATAGSSTGTDQQVARASLVRLSGPGLDEAFVRGLSSGEGKTRAEVARAIGQRNLRAAFGELLRLAQSETENPVRRELIVALGRVGTAADLPRLIELATRPKQGEDREGIGEAISQVFGRTSDRQLQAAPLLAALPGASAELKPMLLGLLSQPATTEALAAVRSALSAPEAGVREAASRALGEWPNADPAEDLRRIVLGKPDSTTRALALRGYVRLAALAEDPTAHYVQAMGLAQTVEERKLVLGGLGNADTVVALELAEKHRSDPGLEAEAGLAVVQVAAQIAWTDPARATAALTRVIAEAKQDPLKRRAQDVLKRMEEFKNYLVAWKGAGPYQLEGVNDGRAVFDTPFAPEEEAKAAQVRWRTVKAVFEGDKRLNLEATFGQTDYVSAYVRTTVWSETAQEVRLAWAVDDYIKGWLNGRPVSEGRIMLKEGENVLMLKVGDHGGEWNFNCRLLKADGTPASGLRCEAK